MLKCYAWWLMGVWTLPIILVFWKDITFLKFSRCLPTFSVEDRNTQFTDSVFRIRRWLTRVQKPNNNWSSFVFNVYHLFQYFYSQFSSLSCSPVTHLFWRNCLNYVRVHQQEGLLIVIFLYFHLIIVSSVFVNVMCFVIWIVNDIA
jgi:hypothetical protein